MQDVELAASKLSLRSSGKIKLIAITGGEKCSDKHTFQMHLDIISTWFVSF